MKVLYERRGELAVLQLNRPERRNAVDSDTAKELLAGYQRFIADDACKVLIVAGSADVFCAGADLKSMNNNVDSPGGPMGFTRHSSPKPTIAAIEGYCVAGGLEIALWCDLRVASHSAKLGCLERRWGVPLVDGGTQRLAHVVGLGRAMDLMLTGRVIDVTEAERIGLVNRICDVGRATEVALTLGEEIASAPWECVLADRASLLEGLGETLPTGLKIEAARGREVLTEARTGAARFAGGAGRHGRRNSGPE